MPAVAGLSVVERPTTDVRRPTSKAEKEKKDGITAIRPGGKTS